MTYFDLTQNLTQSLIGFFSKLFVDYVSEHPRHLNTLQLPFRVLVEAADADIADALTLQDASKGKSVRMKSITFDGICQSIGNLTLF